MYTITIHGVEILVEKKRIKNMYLRVLPPDGKVRITAPIAATEDAIRGFAVSRIAWIQKHRQRFAGRPRQAKCGYDTGDSCYLWGKPYGLQVVFSDAESAVSVRDQSIVLTVRSGSTPQQRARVMERWYRQALQAAIPPLRQKWEGIVGVKAAEFRVKNMRTRWGTCNTQAKRIWVSLALAQKPPECLEYVIAHELVHLLERSHNEVFQAHMDRLYPAWRAVRARLNGTEG